MSQTYYVTTPIYYVNDSPHIGHSYTTIAADVLARFFRAAGRDVHFLTGTDEHGIKIFSAAAERGVTPRDLADEVVVHFQNLWGDLDISYDDFIRTTDPRHERRVQQIVSRLVEKDQIYLGRYEGWYDEGQEQFVTESAARDNNYKSQINGEPLVRYSEESYFFRLGGWIPKLIEHIVSNPTFIQPDARRNEVLSKLRMGVDDLCISRPAEKLSWGVPMPNDDKYVVYVWIDALSNYVTALGWPELGDDDDGVGWKYWPADVQLIGKDILWFHTVYWPCMLMALDAPLPKCVFAHGWWTAEGKKMSTSLGNFVSRQVIADICREYSVDVFRYFLLRSVAFGADGDFSHEMLSRRYNGELANGIGNLLSRTVNMIDRYFDGAIPPRCDAGDSAKELLGAAADLHRSAVGVMELCGFHVYIDKLLALTGASNRFIDATQPFKLAKDQTQRQKLSAILYTCAEAVRIILLYLRPIMPTAAAKGLAQIGWTGPDGPLETTGAWGLLSGTGRTGKPEPLFPRTR